MGPGRGAGGVITKLGMQGKGQFCRGWWALDLGRCTGWLRDLWGSDQEQLRELELAVSSMKMSGKVPGLQGSVRHQI